MRGLLLIVCFLGIAIQGISQGIVFRNGSFQDILRMSMREGKPIFIHISKAGDKEGDLMEKNVIYNKKVGDFFNANFISFHVDADKQEVLPYKQAPEGVHYWFLNEWVEWIDRAEGYKDVKDFIALGKAILDKCQKRELLGIQFQNKNLEEVLKVARKEKKPVFIDVYKIDDGMCRTMEKRVIRDEKVGEFFNAHFLSIRVDVDKEENVAVLKKYGVSKGMYYLFFNEDGELIHKTFGIMDTGDLIFEGKKALEKYGK